MPSVFWQMFLSIGLLLPSAPAIHPGDYKRWKQILPIRRYHYQYAIIASTPFTVPAQAYAFGHDIALFPLGRSHYFRPIVEAIQALTLSAFEAEAAGSIDVDVTLLRQALLS